MTVAKVMKRRQIDEMIIEYLKANGIDPNIVSGYSIEDANGQGDGLLILQIPLPALTEPSESDTKE